MKKIFFFLPALCLLLLSACLPSSEGAPQPAAPTSEVSKTSEVLTPTPAPTETPTPTPVPPAHPSAFDAAFERGVVVFQDGQWLARVTLPGENGQPQPAYYQIIPDTFNANDELAAKNPLAPLTLRARPLPPNYPTPAYPTPDYQTPDYQTPDSQTPDYPTPDYQTPDYQTPAYPTPAYPTPAYQTPDYPTPDYQTPDYQTPDYQTLLWNAEKAEFRLAPALPAVFDGVNTDAPRFNPEAYAGVPRFAVEDIQSGLAVQSLLLHIQERLASGESLSDILYIDPQATRSAWENLGGNSLFFKLRPDGKAAWLKAKGNDKSARDQRYDNLTMKVLPYGAQIRLNGQDYFAFYIANFDPLDAQNPDPLDLANWKFFLGIETYYDINTDKVYSYTDDSDTRLFWKKETRDPWIYLYGDEQFRQNHPFFDALLKIEGNDPLTLPSENNGQYYYLITEIIKGNINAPESAAEILDSYPLAPQIQTMFFLFDVRSPF